MWPTSRSLRFFGFAIFGVRTKLMRTSETSRIPAAQLKIAFGCVATLTLYTTAKSVG